MSDDRQARSDADRGMSDAYRKLSQERVPEHLDRSVLRQAAGALRRSGMNSWLPVLRPLVAVGAIALVSVVVFRFAALDFGETISPGNETDARKPVQAGGIADPGREVPVRQFCDEQATASAEAWLSCIAELEQSGRADAAASERDRFEARHAE